MPMQSWLWRVLKWTPEEINLVPNPGAQSRRRVVDNVARGFAAFRGGTTYVLWTLEGANVRMTFDGNVPVAGAFGHLYVNGATGIWPVEMAAVARFVREGVANAAFHVTQLVGRP